jgi:hypothetical protein
LALLCLTVVGTAVESTNSVSTAATGTNRCAHFTLQDQFEKTHQFTFPQAKPVVLTVADKKGSEDIKAWAHPLAEKFGDQIIIAGLADVSTVPPPLRGLVRSKFKKAISYPVMLDWEGGSARGFHYAKGRANVYLISPDGRVMHHLSGKADEAQLANLIALIEAQISSGAQAKARSN